MNTYTATYSPDDNKLRLYASSRLDPELYARAKALGFRWAPKQELFVAPMWTPQREDFLIELAGEITDEDISLVDRAEERAERFEGYKDNRAKDAEQAYQQSDSISARFEVGQPILIGHHSEKKARKDQERMHSAMSRSVKMWETSAYWKSRAAGALHHAKYKELPGVRARRIKGIEADKRKQERNKAEAEKWLKKWSQSDLTHEQALGLANYCHLSLPRKPEDSDRLNFCPSAYDLLRPDANMSTLYVPRTLQEVIDAALSSYPSAIAYAQRWIDHYENRLVYERAMLGEQGGLVSDKATFEPGGQVKRRGQWFVVVKVNPQSVSVIGHWKMTVSFDEIQDYRPPKEGDAEKVLKVFKKPPLCNYPGEGFKHMTKAEVKADRSRQWSDFPKTIRVKATETQGAHMVKATQGEKAWSTVGIFITDAKITNPPPVAEPVTLPTRDVEPPTQRITEPYDDSEHEKAQAIKEQLKNPAPVIVAPTLYPTPKELAERMAELLDVQPGERVLEPSAGTGMLLGAIGGKMFDESNPSPYKEREQVVAVEINQAACDALKQHYPLTRVEQGDFLTMNGDLGDFDKILMNPPFNKGQDVRHIQHAQSFLKPGGRLVALCANGPRQHAILKPMARVWEELPPGTFKEAGTNVNVALLIIE